MTMRHAALCLLTLTTASIAIADDKAKDLKGDLAKLQGTWSSNAEVKIRVVIEGKNVQLEMTKPDGDDFKSNGEITVDEESKPHKSIVWSKLTDSNGGVLSDIQSIYTFEDENTLKVCSGNPGDERPTEFQDGAAQPPHITVLKREKAKDSEKPAAATTPEEIKGDLGKFQGKWTTKVGPNRDIPLTVTIKKQEVTLSGTTPNGQDFELKGELKVDDQAKPFKTLDWVKFTGPQGNAVPDNLAIYELEDADTIKVCGGGPGNERPTEFKDGDNGHPHVLTLKRSKD